MLFLLFFLMCIYARLPGHRRPHPRFLLWRKADTVLRNGRRFRPKPAWVMQEVLRLKARMPQAGCRSIQCIFNRLHGINRRMTVGKTFVALALRRHRREIERLRRDIRRAQPRSVPKNLVWGLDLTGKPAGRGSVHPILGIVDHGTRACLVLAGLPDKSAITILRTLLDVIERHGKPRCLRTDNEAMFTSRLFGFALCLLGIRHQRTELHCPWQNGRVERFFGTLKQKLDCIEVRSREALNLALSEFRFFYAPKEAPLGGNHVRPHQNLGGRTPAEAWAGVPQSAGEALWFEAWGGLLQGYYQRR